jgi:hypothetical protein
MQIRSIADNAFTVTLIARTTIQQVSRYSWNYKMLDAAMHRFYEGRLVRHFDRTRSI